MSSATRTLDERRALVEAALAKAVSGQEPDTLYAPARYVLEGGGKRLRPLLALLAAEAHGADAEDALPAAVAVEVFHNFTLVHDDIMDRSLCRRGRPTVHVRWDEPTAILVGDLLLGIAYDHLARLPIAALAPSLEVFGRCVTRLCEGQMLDMEFERRPDVTIAQYIDMIERKTGALLSCALELGAIVGSASRGERESMREAGLDIGRAFQIQDDLLDLTAESPDWGKAVGGDLVEGKRTYPLLLALERVRPNDDRRALLERVVGRRAGPDDVPAVCGLMEATGVLADTRSAVILHTDSALGHLSRLASGPAKEALADLVRGMQRRAR